MEAVYKTAEIAANLFDAAGAVVFLVIIFGVKDRVKNKSLFYVMSMAFIMVLAIFQDVSDNVVIQFIIMIIIDITYELLFLNGKTGEKLIYNILYNMIILITNMFTVFGMVAVIHVDMEVLINEGSYLRVITLIINKVMIMIFLVSIILFTKRKQFEYQEWVIAVLMYITTVFTDTIFINIVKTGRLPSYVENQFIWAALGLFLIDIIISVCIYKLNKQYHYKMDNMVLNAKLEEEKYMLEKIEEMHTDNQILQHDLNRYLSVVQGLIASDKVDEASDYLEKVIGSRFNGIQIYKSNSSVVNSVLNDKGNICRKKAIPYDVEVSGIVPEDKQIEIGIILSNLIDNAIEAEERETEKWIKVEMSEYKGVFIIQISNYIGKSVLKENPLLLTGKKDFRNHGVGTRSVKKTVKKLGGVYYNEEGDNQFIANVMLN